MEIFDLISGKYTVLCERTSCREKVCGSCDTFKSFIRISDQDWRLPEILSHTLPKDSIFPVFWIRHSQSHNWKIPPEVLKLTRKFYLFKDGEMAYAYPFALGIYEKLRMRGEIAYDLITPIPLSPDKVHKGEPHRTKKLAEELGNLLSVPVKELLSLKKPISKRCMKKDDPTLRKFREKFEELLSVEDLELGKWKVLLVDDILTTGSTVSVAIKKLKNSVPGIEIKVATIGLFIVKDLVQDCSSFVDSD